MKVPLPGPGLPGLPGALTSSLAEVGSTARATVTVGASAMRDGVELALDLAPRLTELLDRFDALLTGADAALRRVDDVVTSTEAAVHRADAVVDRVDMVMTRVDEVMHRVDGVFTSVEDTRQRADEVISAVDGTRKRADAAVDAVDTTRERADTVAQAVEATRAEAEAITRRVTGVIASAEDASARVGTTVEGAGGLLDRTGGLLDAYEPALRGLAPQAQRLAHSIDGKEIDAAVALVDRLPVVLAHLDEDVLPVLQQMDRVGPDVHALLEAVEDVRRVLTGLPGAKLFRRRGDED